MVGVHSSIVIGQVTSHAGIGCVVIVAMVTSSTIVGNVGMRTDQGIIIVVNREGSGFPARRRGMAHGTISRNVQQRMFRIEAGIVICLVTGYTGSGYVQIIPMVAGIAIVGNGQVRPG